MARYWIVNLQSKRYFPIEDRDGSFFDGEWKNRTPFRSANYIDLSAQKIRPEQTQNEHLFYDADLSANGLIVGVYADQAHVTRGEAERFLDALRQKQDVACGFIHMLTREKSPMAAALEKMATSDNALRQCLAAMDSMRHQIKQVRGMSDAQNEALQAVLAECDNAEAAGMSALGVLTQYNAPADLLPKGISLSSEAYQRKQGACCPACESEQIQGHFIEVNAGMAHQEIDCLDCGASWSDDYALTGYSTLVVPEPNEEEDCRPR